MKPTEKVPSKEQLKQNLLGGNRVAFCFDTTGSMRSCIADVRQKLGEIAAEMFTDMPDLQIALIAHGDYCDGPRAITLLDFTNDQAKIQDFLKSVPNTSGGDAPECYELALNQARTFSWPEEGGTLVMIGDDEPHSPDYPMNTNHLDWKQELQALLDLKVKVFAMRCLRKSQMFWQELADAAQTPLLELEGDFQGAMSSLESIAYASGGKEVYDGYMSKARVSSMRCIRGDLAANTAKLKAFMETEPVVEDKPPICTAWAKNTSEVKES